MQLNGGMPMSDIAGEETEDNIFGYDFPDEALEAAACAERIAAYTQIAYCTMGVCPGG
jgi:hypothetical protein